MREHGFQRWAVTAALLLTGTAMSAPAHAADIYLRAATTTATMPDGRVVTLWGFARDSAFGAGDGTVTVPGPELALAPGDTTLRIHLENDLPERVSLVIPGQRATMTPVWGDANDPADPGVSGARPAGDFASRVRSFTHETPSGNAAPVVYEWTNLRPGTYLYQSGTHPAVQIQMGLYGVVKRDAAPGEAYGGVPYDREVTIVVSELDPELHDAVRDGRFGPGPAPAAGQPPRVTSTVDYRPRYFLVNGQAAGATLPTAAPGERVLLRLLNAGLQTRVLVLQGLWAELVAEDGFAMPHPKERYSVLLPAGKTVDALVPTAPAGSFPVYDRRLAPGMRTRLVVAAP